MFAGGACFKTPKKKKKATARKISMQIIEILESIMCLLNIIRQRWNVAFIIHVVLLPFISSILFKVIGDDTHLTNLAIVALVAWLRGIS